MLLLSATDGDSTVTARVDVVGTTGSEVITGADNVVTADDGVGSGLLV